MFFQDKLLSRNPAKFRYLFNKIKSIKQKNLVWLIGLCVLVALTLKELVPLFDEYQNNNVGVQVSNVVDADNFTPPHLVIGIPFYQSKNDDLMAIARYLTNQTGTCTPCDKLMEAGWSVWKIGNGSPNMEMPSMYASVSLDLFQKLLENVEKGGENVLLPSHSSWNEPIFSATMNFFMWLWESDLNHSPPAHINPSLVHKFANLNSHPMIDIAFKYLLEGLCGRLDFSELIYQNDFHEPVDSGKTCYDLLLNSTSSVQLDEKWGLYFSLPIYASPRVINYKFSLWPRENSWSWIGDTEEKHYDVFPDISMIYAIKNEPIYSSFIYSATRKKAGLNITIMYGVQIRAKETRKGTKCTNETNGMTCFTKCTKLWVIEKCGCVPFSMKVGLDYDSRLPHCTIPIYTICNISATIPDYTKEQCMAKCKNLCDYTSYNWHIDHVSYDLASPGNQSEFNMLIVPMVTSFTEFSMTVQNTPEQFYSQIIGIVNFYLGFDGLSIIVGLTFLLSRLPGMLARKRVTVGSIQDQNVDHGQGFNERYLRDMQDMRNRLAKQDLEIEALKKMISKRESQVNSTVIIISPETPPSEGCLDEVW